jgi:hypothetical protein
LSFVVHRNIVSSFWRRGEFRVNPKNITGVLAANSVAGEFHRALKDGITSAAFAAPNRHGAVAIAQAPNPTVSSEMTSFNYEPAPVRKFVKRYIVFFRIRSYAM